MLARAHKSLGTVLLRYIDTGSYYTGTADVLGAVVQTITKAASGASTPYNYLKWGELVYDDTGETLAQYPANLDRIIVPAGARTANISASFAANSAGTGSTSVTGAADNGSGLIRLTVTSNAELGNTVTVASVTGTTEANGNWSVTKVGTTQIDLVGSTFTNAYVSGGTATGAPGTYRGMRIYGGASGTTNMGNTKSFAFHPGQSNNIANNTIGLPVTPGHILRIGFLQDSVADWVNPAGDSASSYFAVEFFR